MNFKVKFFVEDRSNWLCNKTGSPFRRFKWNFYRQRKPYGKVHLRKNQGEVTKSVEGWKV